MKKRHCQFKKYFTSNWCIHRMSYSCSLVFEFQKRCSWGRAVKHQPVTLAFQKRMLLWSQSFPFQTTSLIIFLGKETECGTSIWALVSHVEDTTEVPSSHAQSEHLSSKPEEQEQDCSLCLSSLVTLPFKYVQQSLKNINSMLINSLFYSLQEVYA